MRSGLGLILCVFSLLAGSLAGCGGGGGATTPPPTSNNPPPAAPPAPPPTAAPPVIGANGGTVTETSGASVIVPAGALTTDTTIRVAMDATGAPVLPEGLTRAGNTYVITPHGGDFAQPVEVRIPAPNVSLQPNQEIKLAKAEPGEGWVVLGDSELNEGVLSADVDSFSFFTPVVITYVLPIAQAEAMRVSVALNCGNENCSQALGTVTATFTVTTNNGQMGTGCTRSELRIFQGSYLSYTSSLGSVLIPNTGGALTRTLEPSRVTHHRFGVGRICDNYTYRFSSEEEIRWYDPDPNLYPRVAVLRAPTSLDVVEGLPAHLDVALVGGASKKSAEGNYSSPNYLDRAIIDWERSDDNGGSWRVIAHSFQNEGNALPYGAGVPWRYWSVRHGFTATVTDQGALLRIHACYTPPDVAAAPCVTSQPTRLNVLQQSALPAIVDAPRSMLVKTGQTANFSATVSGLPAPTVQWQTRPANSNGAWSDVSTGSGATAANYITAPTALSDNGVQYRVVATNAVGTAASTAVAVSVSDLDVAPTITTQPANLSVASGGDAVFAIDARGTEALGYQWYRNGIAMPGANSPVLRLTGVTALNSGSYSVTVSNSAGAADSNAAALSVYSGAPAAVAPTIVTQPVDVTVNAGNTATFAVGVDGSGPLSFQWLKDGVRIPGSTSAVLTLAGVTTGMAGDYSVVVSNAASSSVTSGAAALTVNPNSAPSAPSITTQPATLIVAPGGSGMLAVAATGSGPLSYQWLADGTPMGGETHAVLFIYNAGPSAEAHYAVRISNSLGDVVSGEVQVILLGAPFITQHPTDTTGLENATATFSVAANSSGLHYQWLRNGLTIGNATEASYTTPTLTTADSGAVYSVIVYNGAGVALSQSAVLTVLAFTPPSVTQHPVNTSVAAGSAAPLCATFAGTPPFDVQMTRWSGSAWLPVLAVRRLFDNAQACTTTPVLQLSDNGAMFRFELVSGPGQAYGATTNAAMITVTAPPTAITATTLASRATSGASADNSSGTPSISADGNLVAFTTTGTNLVPGFTNPPTEMGHAYVRNIAAGVTTAINQTPAGTQSSRGVNELKLAAGGRYVIFSSLAGDLVADDTNGSEDVFVRDLQTGITTRISLHADGTQITDAGNGTDDRQLNISADGRFASFVSNQDLIGTGPPGDYALYVLNMQSGFMRRVASSPLYGIASVAMSNNGEYIAYAHAIPAPAPATVHLYDVEANVTSELYSLDTSSGTAWLGQGLSISGNGRYITFAVRSPALFNGSTFPQILAIDRNDPGHITIASGDSNGFGNGGSSYPKVSDDGHVLFATVAPNLTGNVAYQGRTVLLVRDLQSSELTFALRRPDGTVAWTEGVYNAHALSRDGTAFALVAAESMLSSGNNGFQVFVAPRP
jgi:hypothetical protein